ncbi:MAG: LytTR family transcriptional regulator DNA-binding domain-containing protein [Saprospiraceae bacterium]|nr:LytTR family transcriptional regulator DNA-binding domain-containing protein [Saprospiraceae bacterium]
MELLNDHLLLNTAENLFLIPLKDVLFVQSSGTYSYIIGVAEEKWELSRPINAYQLPLESTGFCRIHRSYMVNVLHIRRVDKIGKLVYLFNGTSIPYSRPGYQALQCFLKNQQISSELLKL